MDPVAIAKQQIELHALRYHEKYEKTLDAVKLTAQLIKLKTYTHAIPFRASNVDRVELDAFKRMHRRVQMTTKYEIKHNGWKIAPISPDHRMFLCNDADIAMLFKLTFA